VKFVLIVLATGAAVLAVLAAPAGATNECRGFMVCAPVAGPWVVVPTATSVPRPKAEYELTCPRGFIVGGLDAELTDRGIDVSFEALLGSPVNPGITTKRAALFTGRAVAGPVRTATFRPHIGCIPVAGGGGRIPTVAHVYPPGQPATRRVWTVRVRPGVQAVRKTCATGETLVAASHAVGFFTKAPPGARLAGSVHATRVVRGGTVTVSVRAGGAVQTVKAVVQIDLTCAGGT
jgi:hypothetical protein